jgi:hypothetical protein
LRLENKWAIYFIEKKVAEEIEEKRKVKVGIYLPTNKQINKSSIGRRKKSKHSQSDEKAK